MPFVTITGSQNITVLGITLDSSLSLNKHINSICQSMYFHMRALRHIRSDLTDEMAVICQQVQIFPTPLYLVPLMGGALIGISPKSLVSENSSPSLAN